MQNWVDLAMEYYGYKSIHWVGKEKGRSIGNMPPAFDCSGFVQFVLLESGLPLPHLPSSEKLVRYSEEFFDFYTVAENLASSQRMKVPKLYVIDDTAMNAFATGRDPEHAVICATTGLLQKLDRTELEGVLAHELSHIRNYDTRLMSVVSVLVGSIALLADWFLRMSWYGRGGRGDQGDRGDRGMGAIFIAIGLIFAILSPIVAQLIQLAISRKRELLADASGVKLTRQPDGLARALVKISSDREPLEAANKATAHLYIMNPLKNRHDAIGWFAGMFNTHPPLKERIDQLRLMGAGI